MGLCGSKEHRRLTPMQRTLSLAAKEAVIEYRRSIKARILPSTLSMRRTDVVCEFVVEPWKANSDVDVSDIFFGSFEKSVAEINVAMKGASISAMGMSSSIRIASSYA